MDPLLKDWIQVVSWAVAIVGGFVAAAVALFQLAANNAQRKRELRWQQANAGKQLIDEMLNGQANDALRMLDYPCDRFDIEGYGRVVPDHIEKALKVNWDGNSRCSFPENDPVSVLIRGRFDQLFHHLDRCLLFIENGLVEPRDINIPFGYYAKIMPDQLKPQLLNYGKATEYSRVIKFLETIIPPSK